MINPAGDNLAFLLGLPRSGTTLLSVMLARHPAVLCPPEPWLMLALQAFGKVHPRHPADAQLLGTGLRAFAADDERLLAARACALALYNKKLTDAGRTLFVDKTPRYHLILPYLRLLFPAARTVCLRRNPLDVAASMKATWGFDVPALLRTAPDHRACIDVVVGTRRLAALDGQDGVFTLRYEDLVADPAPRLAGLQSFLGLDPAAAGDLAHFDLAESDYARSFMGDKKILETTAPHARSVGAWREAFDNDDLRTLLDAVGAPFLASLGYADVVDELAARGVSPTGPEATAVYTRRVEAGLAARTAAVEGAAAYDPGGPTDDDANPLATLDQLRENPYVSLVAETHLAQQNLLDTRTRLAAEQVALQAARGEIDTARGETQVARGETEAVRGELAAASDRIAELTPALDAAREEQRRTAAALDEKTRELDTATATIADQSTMLPDVNLTTSAARAGATIAADPFATIHRAPVPLDPPGLLWPPGAGNAFRPNWTRPTRYINDEHRTIWEETKDLPGWQDPGDSEKLYEMAYHDGAVILEIGTFSGRSAAVELKAALRARADRGAPPPQFYGVDLDPGAIYRTNETLSRFTDFLDHVVLYQGTLAHFHRHVPIVPTMVFVDGDHRYEGCLADLKLLATFLAPGTPVYCHDYKGIDGVRRAVDEAVATTGAYDYAGAVAGGMFLRTTARCTGTPRALSVAAFRQLQANLARRYDNIWVEIPPDRIGEVADVTEQTAVARADLDARHGWPYEAPAAPFPAPATLPDGSPWPKISVVTPTYNQGAYIEQTLLSVLNQNYPNVEHIVIDGASTDDTMQVVDRYRHRLARVVSEKDGGQSNAINKGMKLATGEILTWLNSDDLLAPGALYAVALAFHTAKADLVSGVCCLLQHPAPPQAASQRSGGPDPSPTQSPPSILSRHLTTCPDGPLRAAGLLDLDHQWAQGAFWYQPETFFTKALWEKAGGHVDESLHYSMDYDLWLRFAEQGANLHVVGRDLAWYRVHPDQKTFNQADFQPELKKVRDAFAHRTGITPPTNGSVPTATAEQNGAERDPDRHSAFDNRHSPRGTLRLLFFNDLGPVAGAGIGHHRIARAAARAGHDVRVLAVSPNLTDAPPANDEILAAVAEHEPDLVVLGNLHSASLEPSLPGLLAAQYPTVHVLHDFWALTGRCAYPNDCTKYLTGCDDNCPTKDEYPVLPGPAIRAAWGTKYTAYASAHPPYLAGVSRFVEDRIDARFKDATGPRPNRLGVRYGLDLDTFKPRDKATCRDAFDLPQDKFLILFSATNLADTRKGLPHLLQALDQLDLPDVLAVGLGHFSADDQKALGDKVRAVGYVTDPDELAVLYSACDLFVGPSTIETFGQVFIEAAACGTPSVGYAPAGGVAEAVAPGVSGLLAPEIDAAKLAAAIDALYRDPLRRKSMAFWGRLWVENEWSLNSAAHHLIASLHAAGIAGPLGLVPGLRIAAAAEPHPVHYLRPWRDATQSQLAAQAAELEQLRADLAKITRQRDGLRTQVEQMRNTPLWRVAEKTYPTYHKIKTTPSTAIRKLFGKQ